MAQAVLEVHLVGPEVLVVADLHVRSSHARQSVGELLIAPTFWRRGLQSRPEFRVVTEHYAVDPPGDVVVVRDPRMISSIADVAMIAAVAIQANGRCCCSSLPIPISFSCSV